jgi:hypothetical protein
MMKSHRTSILMATILVVALGWQWHRAVEAEARLEAAQRTQVQLQIENDGLREMTVAGAGRTSTSVSRQQLPAATTAAWSAALNDPDPLLRQLTVAQLLQALTPELAPLVAELFDHGPARGEKKDFMRAWGKLDGAAAIAYGLGPNGEIDKAPQRKSLDEFADVSAALAGWAQAQPDQARAWLAQWLDQDSHLSVGLISGWMLTDFDAASAYALTLPFGTARDSIRACLFDHAMATGGLPEVQRWFSNVISDTCPHNNMYRQRTCELVTEEMLRQDPVAAHTANWLLQMNHPGLTGGDCIKSVGLALAETSPGQAMEWMDRMVAIPNEEAQQSKIKTYESVMAQWSAKDVTAADAWLNLHQDHPAYDHLASCHAKYCNDPAVKLSWVESIRDEAEYSRARSEAGDAIASLLGTNARPILRQAGYSEDEIRAWIAE